MKSGIFFVTSRHKKATFNLDVAFLFYSFTCYQCGPFCGIIKPRKELSLCPKLSQFVIWKIPMRFRSAATKRRNPSLWQKRLWGYGYHEHKGSSDVVRGVFIYGNTAQFPPCGLSTAPTAAALRIMRYCPKTKWMPPSTFREASMMDS